MTVRRTSIETYHQIKAEGLLGRWHWIVYNTVYKYGPMTSAEAFRKIHHLMGERSITQSRARFTELRDKGLLRETGTRICTVTGRNVIEWETTNNLPRKRVNKPKIKKVNGNFIHKDVALAAIKSAYDRYNRMKSPRQLLDEQLNENG